MADAKGKKSPDKQADDNAMRDLKSAHAAEFDQLKKEHAERLKEKQGG
jgi:hypothetical protein